jgi:hypothetical protein
MIIEACNGNEFFFLGLNLLYLLYNFIKQQILSKMKTTFNVITKNLILGLFVIMLTASFLLEKVAFKLQLLFLPPVVMSK